MSTSGRHGKLTKSVTVESDDPANGHARIQVSANVVVVVGFAKSYVRFGNIRKGEKQTRTVKILAKDPEKLEIGKITTQIPGLTANMVPQTSASGEILRTVELVLEPERVGQLQGKVIAETNIETHKTISLSVSARVTGDIAASPQRIQLRPGDPTHVTSKLKVTTAKGSFKIKRLDEKTGRLKLTQKTVEKGKAYEINVELAEAWTDDAKPLSTTITIHTDQAEQPTLQVPVYVIGGRRNLRRRGKNLVPLQQLQIPGAKASNKQALPRKSAN